MSDHSDDAQVRRLRALLDQGLAPVQADRRVLAHVLAGPSSRPAARPTWLLVAATAAAVAVVVLVVPALRAQSGLAPGPSTPATGATATPTPSPTPSPLPTRTPTPAPTATRVPAPATTPTPAGTASPSAPAAVTQAGPGCGPSVAGDTSGVHLDLDGDGTDDVISYGAGALRVRLGGGRGTVVSPFSTASPYLTVLPVSTDGTPGAEVLVGSRGAIGTHGSVGSVARLYDLRGCTFAPVDGVNGRPYDFEVGTSAEGERSGVLCEGPVLYGRTAVLRGGVWQVTDTSVSSASGTAVNGPARRSTVADGTAQARDDLARESCLGPPQSLG